MKKMLFIIACLAAVIFFTYRAGAQNVSAGADSIHWQYDGKGKLIGSKIVAEIDNVPKGIPASIAGALVEGKINKHIRVREKHIGISKVFSVPTISRVIESKTEIVYSKAGGWKEYNFPLAVVIEQNSYGFFVFSIILPAFFIFLITLIHFFNFGRKIKSGKLLIFYISILSIILIGGLINVSAGMPLELPTAFVVVIIGAVVCVIMGTYVVGGLRGNSGGGTISGLAIGVLIGFTAGAFIIPRVIWQYFIFFALVCAFSYAIVQARAWLIGKIASRRKTKTAAA